MQHSSLRQNCNQFGIELGLKSIISKTNYYTFQDRATFWNYSGSKVMQITIGYVSFALLD